MIGYLRSLGLSQGQWEISWTGEGPDPGRNLSEQHPPGLFTICPPPFTPPICKLTAHSTGQCSQVHRPCSGTHQLLGSHRCGRTWGRGGKGQAIGHPCPTLLSSFCPQSHWSALHFPVGVPPWALSKGTHMFSGLVRGQAQGWQSSGVPAVASP